MLANKIKHLLSNRFVSNISWLGGAELVQRIFRLATTVTLARVFSPTDYGLMSAIYTVFDLTSTFTVQTGIGAKIIQVEESELAETCNTAYWLNWILCICLFILQFLLAYPIALYFKSDFLIMPIRALGIIYLMFPLYLVQSALIERENRLQVRAWCFAAQAIISNVLLVSLSLLGWGIWSVVLGMILSYPVWIFICYKNQAWRPKLSSISLAKWQDISRFGGKILGVELLTKIRMYLDYLFVARFLGLEALGLYFFAFNAGIGISQSVLSALAFAWYPHFCEVRSNIKELRKRYLGSFKTIATTVVPLVILQTTLARFYVPIIFGEKWISAIPILIIICCSAIPISIYYTTSKLLQSVDLINIDLYWNLLFTIIFATFLLLVVPWGIMPIALTVLIVQLVLMPIFAGAVFKNVLTNRSIVDAKSN
jgi:PST family polysaccharide transporter